ncbi:MAG: hypothetical protein IKO41_06260 [Lachnospiraceae bacterium]|nr:hypothetical protein [Desulfovibrio sp.]MBR4605814.1 hypothetical protein [Lachnospiraceae bacterium]
MEKNISGFIVSRETVTSCLLILALDLVIGFFLVSFVQNLTLHGGL